jgi:transposase
MDCPLVSARDHLARLVRTDPDPRVRRRADALLRLADGERVTAVARLLRTTTSRIAVWRARFLAEGRGGLTDRPRSGRPPRLGPDDRRWLCAALAAGPRADDRPFDVWGLADLVVLLAERRGLTASITTVRRVLLGEGYRYPRPRRNLTHRQNAEAVAQTAAVLAWLQGKHGGTPPPFDWSPSTSARSIATHGWRKCGNAGVTR